MTDIKERLEMTETTDLKLQSTDKGQNSYSGDPLDNIHLTASGNATILLNIGDKDKIKKNEKRDTSVDEEASTSFSVDYYLRSIPLTGWILILFMLLCLLVAVWFFLKTTMAGKALDASLSAGLKLTRESIDIVRDKLAQADKGSELHSDLSAELARLRKKEGDIQLRKKHREKENHG